MKFPKALKKMREGYHVRRPSMFSTLTLAINVYDNREVMEYWSKGTPSARASEMYSNDILADDWYVVDKGDAL